MMKQVMLGWRGWVYAGLWLLLRVAVSQVPGAVVTTTVQDTVYRADGTPAGGSVVLSWGAFTTAGGESIAAGSTSVTLGTNGALSVTLAPNAGATPMGTYYVAVLHLNDGTESKQYWVVPMPLASGAPVRLASIQNQVLPTSVAMQTVSKQYVDNAISRAIVGYPMDASPYVLKAGDTMTGPLLLPGDPLTPLQAADKNYVDENIAAVNATIISGVSGAAGGDLSGSYPNPTVSAVHATSGTLNGVSIGGTNAAAAAVTTLTASGSTALNSSMNTMGAAGTGQFVYNQNSTNSFFGVFNTGTNTWYGIRNQLSGALSYAGYPVSALGAFYAGLAIGGSSVADSSANPLFGVNTSDQSSYGPGNNMFNVQVNKVVTTFHTTLDDGAGGYKGISTAPSGSCSDNGAWVFSQDGHATFCASGTWATKI